MTEDSVRHVPTADELIERAKELPSADDPIIIIARGQAVPWGRTGSRVIQPRGGGKPFATKFTPKKTRNFQAYVQYLANEARKSRGRFEGPVALAVFVEIEPPKSWSVLKVSKALNGEVLPTGRPDADNVLKSCLDACNKILFRDDSFVVDTSARKRYGREHKAVIIVRPVKGETAQR